MSLLVKEVHQTFNKSITMSLSGVPSDTFLGLTVAYQKDQNLSHKSYPNCWKNWLRRV